MESETHNVTRDSVALAVRTREAAKMVGIGTRKLWALSHPRGPIPCFKVDGMVLYPVEQLREWIAAQLKKAHQS